MPGGDGTGPWGLGPMTGRRMGYCAGTGMPGYAYGAGFGGFGRGRGGFGRGARGMGMGYGRGAWWGAGVVPPVAYPGVPAISDEDLLKNEKMALENQFKYFQNALADIEARMKELESRKKNE